MVGFVQLLPLPQPCPSAQHSISLSPCPSTLHAGTKAWGEVSPSSAGVIIPYLSAIDLTGTRTGRAPSFGYSDCLKWGYEDSIKVATFNATQAVGILGLDLTRVSVRRGAAQQQPYYILVRV